MTLTPPGGATWHFVLALLGPGTLCLCGALASGVAGWRRSATYVAAASLLVALGLLATQLRPVAMAAVTAPILDGYLRIGWAASGAATIGLLSAGWRFRPAGIDPFSWEEAPWRWCLRCGLAVTMPVLAFPALWLAAEIDETVTSSREGMRWRRIRLAVAILGSIPAILGLPILFGAIAYAVLAVVVCASTRGWWTWWLAVSAGALLLDVLTVIPQ
ncbi:MAG: hypothetical protein PF961_08605 [Planctomycetota bacterium]|jgi:hypothetical protein|nr:hypothetical protein [Planctomycetota bacterium]